MLNRADLPPWSPEWFAELRKYAVENRLDFYTCVAAADKGIFYEAVTKDQIASVKDRIFQITYRAFKARRGSPGV